MPCAQNDQAERGRELFEQAWERKYAAAPQPDGLGPLFNARSCVACHSLGGVGGAGSAEKNIDLLTPVVPEKRNPPTDLLERLVKLHPAFAGASSVVLHKFSVEPQPYANFRNSLLGLKPDIHPDPARQAMAERAILRKQGTGPLRTITVDGVLLVVSQRNTTPLFGLGRIATITDAEIAAGALRQKQEHPGISGRFMGRFGWRGQVAKLDSFIRSACATELGLKVSTNNQAIDPAAKSIDPPAQREVDLTDEQCEELTAFVAKLPAPRRLKPRSQRLVAGIRNGEALFNSVGCAACHVSKLGKVGGLYSDLLLHDMGTGLWDPAPAPAVLIATRSGYYESGPPINLELVANELRREWKTPPLWGLRDSGPYLHDGRAKTVEDAIVAHGGEAAPSVDRYVSLPERQRSNLLAFLATLAAPGPN